MATPALSAVGACVLKDFRRAGWFWRHFPITPARWRCSSQESRPRGLQSSGPPVGAAPQAKWELAWPEAQEKYKFLFSPHLFSFNVAGIEPFAFPIPGGLGRHRPPVLPSSIRCCLIAGEFRLVLSSAFRLFQVYHPMHA